MSIQAGDFSELFCSENYSDVNVLLYEEPQHASSTPRHAAKRPRGPEDVLPCHRVVLRAFSQYFKTKIDNWSQQQQEQQQQEQEQEQQQAAGSSAGRHSKAARTGKHQDAAAAAGCCQHALKPQIELPVPDGQLRLGMLLIRSIYEAQPALSAVSQADLVQLIVLADRYEVPKVAAAAAAVIRDLPTADLEWETVFTVYRLPAGCAGMEACRQLQTVAASKVRQELGDLELVWGDAEKQHVLMQLPYPVLQQLLSHKRTSVASEDTVLYTLERWFAWQQQHMPPALHANDEELRQLVALVRMRSCSGAYVASVFAAGAVAERALQRAELAQAAAIAGNAAGHWPVQTLFSNWGSPYGRPYSSCRHHTHSCSFTSKQLKGLYQEVKAGAASAEDGIFSALLFEDSEAVFKGMPVCMAVMFESRTIDSSSSCSSSSSSSRIRMSLGLGIMLPGLPTDTVLPRTYRIQTDREPGQQGAGARKMVMALTDSRRVDGAYIPIMFKCDADSWAGFRAWMVQQGWTRPDGSMWLSCHHGEGAPVADADDVVVSDEAESEDDDDDGSDDEEPFDDALERAQLQAGLDEAFRQLAELEQLHNAHRVARNVVHGDLESEDDD